jgi:Carboxypeptidase regulatory-like domain
LRQATIGGDTIAGGVLMRKKPLKFAKVRLYFSSGATAWNGTTDNNGRFATTKVPPGDYRLEVSGWGSTTVHLNPELNKGPFGQTPAWNLMLMDNACVDTLEILN